MKLASPPPLFFYHAVQPAASPQPGIKPVPSAVEAWSLNHWTTREFPSS